MKETNPFNVIFVTTSVQKNIIWKTILKQFMKENHPSNVFIVTKSLKKNVVLKDTIPLLTKQKTECINYYKKQVIGIVLKSKIFEEKM